MRRLALRISISADGFIAGPEKTADWFAKTRSPQGAQWVAEKMGQAGAHLFGRRSFSEIAAFWSNATGPLAEAMNGIPKITFSQSGFDPSQIPGASDGWKDAAVLTGDLTEEVKKLKQQEGNILLAHGGISFVQNLVKTGLVDEFWFAIHPVVLGRGSHLFAELETPLDLQLESSVTFEAGTIGSVYRVR